MAHQNSGWWYDRILGALANLGHHVADQTVGNIRRRYGIEPAPEEAKTRPGGSSSSLTHGSFGRDRFLHRRSAHLSGASDLLCVVFIHLESRRVSLAGITRHPARPGWSRSRATQRPRVEVTWSTGAMRSTIGTRSSRLVSDDTGGRWNQAGPVAGSKSESERVCGEMAAVGKAGVSVETDPDWGGFAATGPGRVRRAFSYGEKSLGQRQRFAVSV